MVSTEVMTMLRDSLVLVSDSLEKGLAFLQKLDSVWKEQKGVADTAKRLIDRELLENAIASRSSASSSATSGAADVVSSVCVYCSLRHAACRYNVRTW